MDIKECLLRPQLNHAVYLHVHYVHWGSQTIYFWEGLLERKMGT